MGAHAASYDYQILTPSRSVDNKAVWAARGSRRRFGSEESEAAREILSEAIFGAWRRVARLPVTGFLGFSLRETEEHACVVGFFRRRLDLHRSVR